MFGRKNKQPKVKEPSPKEILVEKITAEVEALAPQQTLIYQLPEFYWTGFAAFLMVELNPSFPDKGKKYLLCTDKIVDGKPMGKKMVSSSTNTARDAAKWVADREGQFGNTTRFQ